jgi:hypothetical protein
MRKALGFKTFGSALSLGRSLNKAVSKLNAASETLAIWGTENHRNVN